MWLETYFFFSHHTQNSSFKRSINMSSIQSRYSCELVTQAFFKLLSRFKEQHSQKWFGILWISNAFQNSAKPVQFGIFAGRSGLPGSRFWPDTCGMLQQHTVQDKKFPEVAGNISVTSLHTDKYLALEGITLLSQEGGSAREACSVLRRSNRVTIAPPMRCNSRTLLPQIAPLQKCSKANTSLPPNTWKRTESRVPKSKTCITDNILKIKQQSMWHRRLETKSCLCCVSNTSVKSLPPSSSTDHVSAIYFILWLPPPLAFDPVY